MQKFFTLCAALFVGAATLFAQSELNPAGQLSISVQGGPMLSINENSFSYRDNDCTGKLITPQFSASVAYDFTRMFGLRANVGFAKNAGAANVKQTHVEFGNFYPYSFKSINYFVDAVLHLNAVNDVYSAFDPKFYAGIGGGYTFDIEEAPFTKYTKPAGYPSIHPWQKINGKNHVIGFRLGFIAEYNLTDWLGIYADIAGMTGCTF